MILQKARFITLDPKLIKINAESIKEVVAIGIPDQLLILLKALAWLY